MLDDAERTVSRMHAQIVWREGTYRLIDRGSNPALVNGAPLDPGEEVRIDHGDEVQIGGYQLRAEVAAEDDPQNARAMPDATTYAASDDPFAGLFDACAAPSVAHASTLAPPDADVVCGGFELGLDDPASKRTIDELFDLAPGAHPRRMRRWTRSSNR